jgi:hypothetical protein
MTCEEAFKRLYESLNSTSAELTPEKVEENLTLCQSVCQHCKFNKEVVDAIQSGVLKKASPALKTRIMGLLKLSDCA